MVINENINIKKYYRFIEFTSKLFKVDLIHERFKLICLDKYKVETKAEQKVKKFAESYLYLLNNVNQVLTKDIIKICYFLLTNDILEDGIASNLLSKYYGNFEKPSHYLAAYMHLEVLDIVKERKIEFAFMISNYIMLKKNRYVLIPYLYIHDVYLTTIKNKNLNKLILLFSKIEDVDKNDLVYKKITKEDIVEKIKVNKGIIASRYKVEKLYLYGSYAKNIVTNVSDVDFLVIFDKVLLDFEKSKNYEELKNFLYNKIGIKVDLLDFSHALENMDIREMEKVIKLI